MLFSGSSFGTTLDLIRREMDVSVLRREVIANNIANADTPNFKRSVVDFESRIKIALNSEKPNDNLKAKTWYDADGRVKTVLVKTSSSPVLELGTPLT